MNRFLFIIALTCSISLQAEVRVTASRETIRLNESVNVTFTTDEKVKTTPDFSPIEKDFTVITRNQSSSTHIINGKYSQETSWTFNLVSNKEGKAVIPSIKFDQESSKPLEIVVTAPSQPAKGDPIYLETALSPADEVYQQAQLIYTVRLYRAVNLFNGVITAPKVNDDDTSIEQLGPEREYELMQNGTRYLVLERKYAVFPEHTGELVFAPMTFEGQVVVRSSSMFDVQTQYTKLTEPEMRIKVKPIPAPFNKSNWIAAEHIDLSEEWSSDPANIQVGDAITRTVTIAAKGCLASQIPSLDMQIPQGIKQYPDKPILTNSTSELGNTGIKQIKIALIPTQAGTLHIPELRFKWWDVKNNQLVESVLPATDLVVESETNVTPKIISEVVSVTTDEPVLPTWAWALIGMNGVWIIALGAIFFKGKFKRAPKQKNDKVVGLSLKEACKANNPKAAEAWLLNWAKEIFDEAPNNLRAMQEIVKDLSPEFKEALSNLNQELYAKKSIGVWQGKTLYEAFSKFKPNSPKKNKKLETQLLKDLYHK